MAADQGHRAQELLVRHEVVRLGGDPTEALPRMVELVEAATRSMRARGRPEALRAQDVAG